MRLCFDLKTDSELVGEASRYLNTLVNMTFAVGLVPRSAKGLWYFILGIVVKVLLFFNFFAVVFGGVVVLTVLGVHRTLAVRTLFDRRGV